MINGKQPGNPGLRRRDGAAIRKVAAARDAVIDRRILAGAEPVIEVLRDLRPSQPWDTVVRRLNSLDVPRPGGTWTRDSIIRVARRMARDGFIDADLLKAAPKKRDSVDLLTVVAGIVKGMRQRNEEPKLAAIGKALEHMHQRTPHGGSRWSRSSVKNLLDRARAKIPCQRSGHLAVTTHRTSASPPGTLSST
jgi:hypothetical protein